MLGPSFVTVDPSSHFPLHNLPYGIFSTGANPVPRPGVAIGNCVLDLSLISAAGLFSGPSLSGNSACFQQVGRRGGAGAQPAGSRRLLLTLCLPAHQQGCTRPPNLNQPTIPSLL